MPSPHIMHAFGLELHAQRPLPGLRAGPPARSRGFTSITETTRTAIEAGWPAGSSRIIDRRQPDGSLFMSVDYDAVAGWRVEAPTYGLHVIAANGTRLDAVFADGPDHDWQKLLFSQVLPLIATLRGNAVLHAGACTANGRAYGLLGQSGTGKSSVLMHLVAGGAEFFTDDVLVLHPAGDEVLAEPGPRFANLQPHEYALLDDASARRLGPRLGATDKLHHAPPGEPVSTALGGLIFLRRSGAPGSSVGISRVDPQPHDLLAQGFVAHQQDPGRLLAHLETCAAIRRAVPCWLVDVPTGSTAAAVASALSGAVLSAETTATGS